MGKNKPKQQLQVRSPATWVTIFLVSLFSIQIVLSKLEVNICDHSSQQPEYPASYESSGPVLELPEPQQSRVGHGFESYWMLGLLFGFLIGALLRTKKDSPLEFENLTGTENRIPIEDILHSTNTSIAVIDARGRSVFHNRSFISTYGYSSSEINAIGGFFGLFEDSEIAKLYYELYYDTKSWKCEAELKAKNGRIISTLLYADPILSSSNECLGFVFSCTDVTKRKQVEKTLHTRNRAIEASSNGIVISDVRLWDAPIIYINKAFEKITGYPITEIVGRPFLFILDDKENKDTKHQLVAAMKEGKNCNLNISLLRKDRTNIWVELNISPVFNSAGELTHYVGIQSDISNQKKAEQELKQYARDLERTKKSLEDKAAELASTISQLELAKAKAEEATKAKSEFLANISHEIRTPLNGIIGMTDLVLDTGIDSEQEEYLDSIKVSSESLLTIINDILDFSKIEAGKLDLYDDRFSLRETISETIKTLTIRAVQKGLELSYYVSADVPDLLIGDPGRLRQVLVNLVGNSIKFTENGYIRIRVDKGRKGKHRIRLHFSVEDSGIGIPKDKQKLIFNAFDQVDGSNARHYGGTGLGLAISSKLINLMDGRVWVESPVENGDRLKYGLGSIFHFVASFGLAGEKETEISLNQTTQLRDLSVLIVDGDPINQDFLAAMLQSWEMHPKKAENITHALEILRAESTNGNQIELILFDADYPDGEATTFFHNIESHNHLRKVPSILMVSQSKRDGIPGLTESIRLSKPLKPSELFSAILKLIESKNNRPGEAHAEFNNEFKILLAEDNKVNQKLTSRMLEKNGHRVVIAENGIEAIEKVQENTFDLILMDIQMPEMDGYSATQKIRELEKNNGNHIPIIALTAFAMKGDREKCLAAGMDNYLSKPINFKQLKDTINSTLSKQGR
jgi:two-component system sensor histidine kinase/response regulator